MLFPVPILFYEMSTDNKGRHLHNKVLHVLDDKSQHKSPIKTTTKYWTKRLQKSEQKSNQNLPQS